MCYCYCLYLHLSCKVFYTSLHLCVLRWLFFPFAHSFSLSFRNLILFSWLSDFCSCACCCCLCCKIARSATLLGLFLYAMWFSFIKYLSEQFKIKLRCISVLSCLVLKIIKNVLRVLVWFDSIWFHHINAPAFMCICACACVRLYHIVLYSFSLFIPRSYFRYEHFGRLLGLNGCCVTRSPHALSMLLLLRAAWSFNFFFLFLCFV